MAGAPRPILGAPLTMEPGATNLPAAAWLPTGLINCFLMIVVSSPALTLAFYEPTLLPGFDPMSLI